MKVLNKVKWTWQFPPEINKHEKEMYRSSDNPTVITFYIKKIKLFLENTAGLAYITCSNQVFQIFHIFMHLLNNCWKLEELKICSLEKDNCEPVRFMKMVM